MRILHFSDVHIGVENYGRTDPETGLSSRLVDFLDTLDELVDYAIDEKIDLALFCGDAYKSRDPSQTHQREFARRIARLTSENIPVFLLLGNHDIPHVTNRATALDIFPTLEVKNIYIGNSLTTYKIPTKSGPIQIVALPWIRRSEFLSRQDTYKLTPDEINETIQSRLSDAISVEASQLDPGMVSIFSGHVSVGDAKTGSEQWMTLGKDHHLLKSSVALPQFDYVALGHIHRHQILGRNPHVVYSGSLQRVDFGEEDDQKGFCILNLDVTKPIGERIDEFEFRPVKARNFLTITVDIPSGDMNPTDTVIAAIMKHHIEGAIVRIKIKLPAGLDRHLHESEIRNALENAHFIASISKDVSEQTRVRLGRSDSHNIKPIEALEIYLQGREVPNERTKQLLERAQILMIETENNNKNFNI